MVGCILKTANPSAQIKTPGSRYQLTAESSGFDHDAHGHGQQSKFAGSFCGS
jgi:hypothetical protein